MDYHGRIMNIAARHPKTADVMTAHEHTVYKYGHRDARHAAAEIALEADKALREKDAEIARLHSGAVDMLNWKDRTIADYKSDRDEAQAEIARMREALQEIANPLNISRTYHEAAIRRARAALAPAAEVSGG